mmetsp:Transcript_24250/g.46052  ORF Transcript_24250/g.46052 Transcript_24250/m.46052 type:complete len:662 (+) Transcript_24250:134-2119(+)
MVKNAEHFEYEDVLERCNSFGSYQRWNMLRFGYGWFICGAQTMVHIFVTMDPQEVCVVSDLGPAQDKPATGSVVAAAEAGIRSRLSTISGAGGLAGAEGFEAAGTVVNGVGSGTSVESMCHPGGPTAQDCEAPNAGRSAEGFITRLELQGTTAVSSFGLVCEWESLVSLLGVMFFFGNLVGNVAFGFIGDQRGRRISSLVSTVFLQLASFLVIFAPTYRSYAFCRCLTGFGVGGVAISSFVYKSETVSKDKRSWLVVTDNSLFCIGASFAAVAAYLIIEWRHLLAVIFAAGLVQILCVCRMDESPKWLAAQGQLEAAHAVLCNIAARNSRPTPPSLYQPSEKEETADEKKEHHEQGFKDLLQRPMGFHLLGMALTWFSSAYGAYGIALNAENLGNIYVSTLLLFLSEIPFFVGIMRMYNHPSWGRRMTNSLGFTLSGIFCAISILDDGPMRVVAATVGRCFAGSVFSALWLYTSELFTTRFRSSAVGICSMFSRWGAVVAPLALTYEGPAVMLSFSVCLFCSGVVCFFLPETLGRPLPDTVEELKETCREGDAQKSRGCCRVCRPQRSYLSLERPSLEEFGLEDDDVEQVDGHSSRSKLEAVVDNAQAVKLGKVSPAATTSVAGSAVIMASAVERGSARALHTSFEKEIAFVANGDSNPME